MIRTSGVVVLTCLLLVCLAGAANANVLFKQLPNYYLGYYSNIPQQQIADNFSPISGGGINGIQWWGGYVSILPTDSFTLRFYADQSGQVGALIGTYNLGSVSRTDMGFEFTYGSGYGNVYYYSSTLSSPFNVSAGTTYWLSILNGTSNNWIWADKDRSNWAASRGSDSGSWYASNIGDRAFILESSDTTVPEPTSLLLLGISLGVIGVATWRKR
jgi:hypothetical protein